MSISVRADRRLIRAEARQGRRFVRVDLIAPEAPPRAGRVPVNLAFVLDRSGSMGGEKIACACDAAVEGIRSLWPEDRFAVVSYDHVVDVVVPTTLATPAAKAAAEDRVRGIEARASTDLHAGWAAGCDEIARALRDDATGRCLLLTDGLANSGLTDHDEIVMRAAAIRRRGVATSAFGIGADFDEVLLARLAESGGGNFHFVEGAAQIPEFIAGEVGEALAVTARDVVLVVEAGEGVTVDSVNEFPCSRANGAWRVELGSLFSGQRFDAVVRVTFPEGRAGDEREVRIRVEDRDGAFAGASAAVAFTYAGHEENDRQERDRAVDRRVASLYAAQASRRALELNRAGELKEARAVLRHCLDRVRRYAGDDPELLEIVRDLERRVERHREHMDDVSRKTFYTGDTMNLKSRAFAMARRPARPPAPARLVVVASAELEAVVRPALAHLAVASPSFFGPVPLAVLSVGPEGSDTLLAAAEVDLVDRAADPHVPADALRIVFTRRRLGDNWFSHWHELRRTAVVSMADWEGTGFSVPPEAFAAYEIVLHALRLLAPGCAPESLMHDETRGCLFDFCESRPDVERKLRRGTLCAACRRALSAAGLSPILVEELLGAVRRLAAPATVVH